MFGMLKPNHRLLSRSERRRHMSCYCNLCGLLRDRYGLKSRMLVVHDIATLWWLIEGSSAMHERPLALGNCLRGSQRQLRARGELSDLQKMIAALSAYTVGVKTADDELDEQGWRSWIADRMYRNVFAQARDDLAKVGFDITQLEELLKLQEELEGAGETDFIAAAAPTSQAYGLVAKEIAIRCQTGYTPHTAQQVGEALGRAVYLVDALRDYSKDYGVSYNPLCLQNNSACELTTDTRHQVLRYLGAHLAVGRNVAAKVSEDLKQSWHAVERKLLAAAGVSDRKSVTLYANCFMPCGDGVVQFDDEECMGHVGTMICCFGCCFGCCLSSCAR